jgi:hypothetical protein
LENSRRSFFSPVFMGINMPSREETEDDREYAPMLARRDETEDDREGAPLVSKLQPRISQGPWGAEATQCTTAHVGAGAAAGESKASFGDPLDPRRAHMLTASRFGEALGLSRYHAPIDLWQLLTGRIVDERGDSAACVHGQTTEAEARALYSARCGRARASHVRASHVRAWRLSHALCE